MFETKSNDPSATLANQVAQSADQAIRSTQRVANDALDGVAGSVKELRNEVGPMVNQVAERASALAQRGADALHRGSQPLIDKAQHAADSTTNYIRAEPVKAMLIAAATGAALMGLITLVNRSHHRN